MEITERLSLKPIHWLSQLSYSEFVEQCLNKDKNIQKKSVKLNIPSYKIFVKLI